MNTPAGEVVGLDSYRKVADRHQAQYYRGLLEAQRVQVQEELAGHVTTLARYHHAGDLGGVRRVRRLVRAKETELNTIDHLLKDLQKRFGPPGVAGRR
jgi:hypothetical protein